MNYLPNYTLKIMSELQDGKDSDSLMHAIKLSSHQGNKKFKETRNWIFISIHYIFIIYTTFKG